MNQKTKEYSILIGGAAGEGSKKAGLIIAKILTECGYYIYIYEDYQSTIKGGHNFSLIRASEKRVLGSTEKIDFLLALNKETVEKHQKKLKDKKQLIFNSDAVSLNYGTGVPIETITKCCEGVPIMKNTGLIAAFGKSLGIDWQVIKKILTKELPIATNINLKIARDAYDKTPTMINLKRINNKNSLSLLSGNEAVTFGALDGGLDAYVSYPMTPTTGILNNMALIAEKHKLKVVQPENEISVVIMALGLAFAGNKTMIASSGGGFALMNEGISLSAQSETPLVIVEGQRMGPSTGMPTYGGQTDLLYVLNAGHGDFERFIVAPGDAEQAYKLTKTALNISWKYQMPSIIFMDKDLCENTFTFDKKIIKKDKTSEVLWDGKGEYLRYKNTKEGISPLAFPGRKNATIKATSYEHDEFGISVEEEKSVKAMQDKRIRKYRELEKEISKTKMIEIYGNKKSETAIIAWGSVKGIVAEVAEELNLKMIQPLILNPFPKKQMERALKGVKNIIVVEMSALGQFAKFLEGNGIKFNHKILKYTGRPFTKNELIKNLKNKK